MKQKLSYYLKKSMRLGVRNIFKVFYIRIQGKYWRYSTAHNKASRNILNVIGMNTGLQRRNLSYIKSLYTSQISPEQVLKDAQIYVAHQLSFLGSSMQFYEYIPWHTDIRLQQQSTVDVIFDKTSLYYDISIKQGTTDALVKDIKVPWELSRFQFLYVLGKAYTLTQEQRYVDSFVRYIQSWLDENPYLYGVNWLCPMEVGIRAINWIIAWEFFKKSSSIPEDFSQQFLGSMYDHMIYLENNWEFYDSRTNNHYLSNLVAYFYLCWFFNDVSGIEKKRTWVVQEILSECKKQIFSDGTSYEGSTHYHCLVTELFYHAFLLFQEMHIEIPDFFYSRLSLMFDFINWCMVNDTHLISIGDNDSGKVLYWGLPKISPTLRRAQGERREKNYAQSDEKVPFVLSRLRQGFVAQGSSMKSGLLLSSCLQRIEESKDKRDNLAYFPHFGLSIIKKNQWHVTLRHHAYNALQPSGHFHNDVGSITLAVNGIPVIVDPGSFVYTPSIVWRNYFRSVTVHNTSFIVGKEPVPLDDQLFVLSMPECMMREEPYFANLSSKALAKEEASDFAKASSNRPWGRPLINEESVSLHAAHTLYEQWGLQFVRRVDVNHECVQITDKWADNNEYQDQVLGWNFTLAPNIIPQKKDDHWILTYQNQPLLIICSDDLTFTLEEGWYSDSYGHKVVTYCLRATRSLNLFHHVFYVKMFRCSFK